MAKGSSGKSFDPCPAGMQQCVCCDVQDLGLIEKSFQGRTKTVPAVKLIFQTARVNPRNGRRFVLHSAKLTNSLDPKAALRAMIESWEGRKLSPEEERNGFDLDKYVGRNALIGVIHRDGRDGVVFANIGSIGPLMEGMTEIQATDYVRQVDRVEGAPVRIEDAPDWEDVPPPADSEIPTDVEF